MIKSLIKTEDEKYSRDAVSGAILNTDTQGYVQFLREREQQWAIQNMAQKVLRVEQLTSEVQNIREEMSDIKQLLLKLIHGK